MSSSRPLHWRDLPLLQRYRGDAFCLNSRREAVGGVGLLRAGVLALLSAATGFAAVVDDATEAVAVAAYDPHEHLAAWLYVAPAAPLPADALPALADALVAHPALPGAHALWAEAPQRSPWLPALRRAGFRVFARHRVWQWLPAASPPAHAAGRWVWPSPEQRWQADRLYADLTPPLVRHLLPSPAAAPTAVVYVEGDRVRGVARWLAGERGVWVAPVLHPDLEHPDAALAALAAFLPQPKRPRFVAVRDSQMWLESSLTALGARPGEPLALLARWIARPVTAAQPAPAAAVRDAPQPTLFSPD